MNYNDINLISNYLALVNDKKIYSLINDIFINNDIQNLQLEISKNTDLIFLNHSTNETLDCSTLTFCKFTKESIFECLFNINQHFYNYNLGENIYNNYNILDELNKIGFNFNKNDENNKQINKNNSRQNGHDGMHFFPHCPIKLIKSNFIMFGEKFVIAINDPQLIQAKDLRFINNNDLNFKNIFINKIYSSYEPLYLKELFQYCATSPLDFKRLLRLENENFDNVFDVLIDKLKLIEYTTKNINELKENKSIVELSRFIYSNYQKFEPQKYKASIDFLTNAKNLYFNMINTNTFDKIE